MKGILLAHVLIVFCIFARSWSLCSGEDALNEQGFERDSDGGNGPSVASKEVLISVTQTKPAVDSPGDRVMELPSCFTKEEAEQFDWYPYESKLDNINLAGIPVDRQLIIEAGKWDSGNLTSILVAITARDLMNRRNTIVVQRGDLVTLGDRLLDSNTHVHMESWGVDRYEKLRVPLQQGRITSLGSIGYGGRNGVYITSDTVTGATGEATPEWWRSLRYTNSWNRLPPFNDTAAGLSSCSKAWCKGKQYFTTTTCDKDRSACRHVRHALDSYYVGIMESLFENLGFPAQITYNGEAEMFRYFEDMERTKTPAISYSWYPTISVGSFNFSRVMFDPWSAECYRQHSTTDISPGMVCDQKEEALEKLVSNSLITTDEDMFSAVKKFSLPLEGIEQILVELTKPSNTDYFSAVCNWMKANPSSWTDSVLVRPSVVEFALSGASILPSTTSYVVEIKRRGSIYPSVKVDIVNVTQGSSREVLATIEWATKESGSKFYNWNSTEGGAKEGQSIELELVNLISNSAKLGTKVGHTIAVEDSSEGFFDSSIHLVTIIIAPAILLLLVGLLISWHYHKKKLRSSLWIIDPDDLVFNCAGKASQSFGSSSFGSAAFMFPENSFYKGSPVCLEEVVHSSIKIDSEVNIRMNKLKLTSHANLLPFLGAVLRPPYIVLVYEFSKRGTLEDVYHADFKMNYTFFFSLLTDVCEGMKYLHNSCGWSHGTLSSFNCHVSANWVCKVGGFNLSCLHKGRMPVKDHEDECFEELPLLLYAPPNRIAKVGEIARKATLRAGSKISRVGEGKMKISSSRFSIEGADNFVLKVMSVSRLSSHLGHLKRSLFGDSVEKQRVTHAWELLQAYRLDIASYASDVWSFGVIVSELLYREMPYLYIEDDFLSKILSLERICVEVDAGMETSFPAPHSKENSLPSDVEGMDNQDKLKIDESVAGLISKCLQLEESKRPSFASIRKELDSISPLKTGVSLTDRLYQMLKEYSDGLEALVVERTREVEYEKEKMQTLLHDMLPASIADKLQNGQSVEPEAFECVTIFFSDIVGFTKLASSSTPFEIVHFLNALYTTFDEVLDVYDVYKVETIGDSYMVVSGLPSRNGDLHAHEVATMSLHLLHTVDNFTIPHEPGKILQLRSGIHSGPVVAGVAGIKMPRYCLFGDTVNTASRMESGGLALRVHLSNDTALILQKCKTETGESEFVLESRGIMQVKGKGEMNTWWLKGKRQFALKLPRASSLAVGMEDHEFK
eukprot:Nk52_evm18s1705 gene=Nk52_evmTU18s1705